MTTSVGAVMPASLGPSEVLFRGYLHGEISWPEYTKRYQDELFEGGCTRLP